MPEEEADWREDEELELLLELLEEEEAELELDELDWLDALGLGMLLLCCGRGGLVLQAPSMPAASKRALTVAQNLIVFMA